MVATVTPPEAPPVPSVDLEPPSTDDPRVRHFVERISPKGELPPRYSRFALCGKKVDELVFTHNGEICQKCVEVQQQKPVER